MGTRNLDKEMLKSHRNFSTTVKLCKDAHSGNKVARFKGLLSTLQTTFTKFDEDFALYKDDIIKKVTKSETAFNEVVIEEGVEIPAFENSDSWADTQFLKFVETRDLLENVLDAATQPAAAEVKAVDSELAVDVVRAEFLSLESSIDKLMTEIENQISRCQPTLPWGSRALLTSLYLELVQISWRRCRQIWLSVLSPQILVSPMPTLESSTEALSRFRRRNLTTALYF